MFINPRVAIENGWVTYPHCDSLQDWADKKFISPNAIDFPIDILYSIHETKPFFISESGKIMRGGKQLTPTDKHPLNDNYSDHVWILEPQTCYDGMSNMHVEVPEGVAAYLQVRSTFNRNGIFLVSGIYDSLFKGSIGFVVYNTSGHAYVVPGTRIGQLIFVESDNSGSYEGGYNTNPGQHWSEITK